MTSDKIYLKWAKSDNPENNNFGDDLGPYIIEKLTGNKVTFIRYATKKHLVLYRFLRSVLIKPSNLKYYRDLFLSIFIRKYIISIGSILQWYGSKRCIVWGAGVIDSSSHIEKCEFLAVRGKYTKEIIERLGYKCSNVLGDPALLLPIVYSPQVQKKVKLGIIPHVIHYDYIVKMFANTGIRVINLNQKNIESIVDEIIMCEHTISTSLHGIIVSHAYGVESLWFKVKDKPLAGDNIKFLDYFSSVDIPDYTPFELVLNSSFEDYVMNLFTENKNKSCINNDLANIQSNLIKVAPFVVKSKFKFY